MRTVVGVILLVLAVGLASLGLYFWTAPSAKPTETPPVITADAPTKRTATTRTSAAEDHPAPTVSPPSPVPSPNAEDVYRRQADVSTMPQTDLEPREADAKRAAVQSESRLKATRSDAAQVERRQEARPRERARELIARSSEQDSQQARARQALERPEAASQAAAPQPIEQPTVAKPQKDEKPTGDGADKPDSKDFAQIVENRKRIEQLPKGDIVLDGPSAMKVNETRAVHANVGLNVPIETLRGGLRSGSQVDEGKLAVSSEMIAVLSGPGFKITASTPEQQSVAEGYPTVWSWDVEAKSAGDQELEATLYALTPARQRIASYKHKISVSVMEQTWGEWVKSFRDEIDAIKGIVVTLSGVVTGLVGWLVLYSDRRRKKEATSVPT